MNILNQIQRVLPANEAKRCPFPRFIYSGSALPNPFRFQGTMNKNFREFRNEKAAVFVDVDGTLVHWSKKGPKLNVKLVEP